MFLRKAVTELLRIFDANEVHATWAAIGFLFFRDINHLKMNFPAILPKYKNEELSPYRYIENSDSLEDSYHFAPELIELIRQYDGQEIGTHTFSHYYCLEEGQSLSEFIEDLSSAIKIAKSKGISLKSLVFPRNQWNSTYLSALTDLGIQCYRGTESSWIYTSNSRRSMLD